MKNVTTDRYPTDYLVSVVSRICRKADPDDPTAVTQRQFDRTRSELDMDCPRAARLVTRFNTPWRDLLALMTRDDPGTFQSLRRAEDAKDGQIPFDEETAVTAVRLAARSLGQNTLSPHEYMDYRARVMRSARNRKRQRLATRWPVSSQISALIGWHQALTRAGLKPPCHTVATGLDNPDAIGVYLECRGYAPPLKVAIGFLRGHGVSAKRRTMKTDEALEVLRQRRKKEGKWTPLRILPHHERTKDSDELLASDEATISQYRNTNTMRARSWWMDEQNMLDGLTLAITKLEPNESLTQVNLRRLAKENRGRIPSPGRVTEFAKRNGTSLPELRERALRKIG